MALLNSFISTRVYNTLFGVREKLKIPKGQLGTVNLGRKWRKRQAMVDQTQQRKFNYTSVISFTYLLVIYKPVMPYMSHVRTYILFGLRSCHVCATVPCLTME